jgi:Thoeris protein ThsB, TIR-like domain
MYKNPVFVSFDYENDRHYKRLLEAWNVNPKFQFVFQDETPGEINSENVGRIKAGLATRIRGATHTLVIIGKYANSPHPKRQLIGYTNWINFEIARSKESGNKLVAVKIDRTYVSPEELAGASVSWAMAFTQEAIIRALSMA